MLVYEYVSVFFVDTFLGEDGDNLSDISSCKNKII